MKLENIPVFRNSQQRTIRNVNINTLCPLVLDQQYQLGRAKLRFEEETGTLFATCYIDENINVNFAAGPDGKGGLVPFADVAFSDDAKDEVIEGINYVDAEWIAIVTLYSDKLQTAPPSPQPRAQ